MIKHTMQWIGLYSLVFLILTGCAVDNRNETTTYHYDMDEQAIPVLWIAGMNGNYQPTYGYRTIMDTDVEESAVYMNQEGFQLGFTNTDRKRYLPLDNVQFQIQDSVGNALSDTASIAYKQDGRFVILPEGVSNVSWEMGQYYNLHIEWIQPDEVIYYDLPVYYSESNPNEFLANQVKTQQIKAMEDEQVQYMGEPLIQISHAGVKGATISMIFTGAARVDESFDYRDYEATYTYEDITQTVALESSQYKEKQRYRFNQETKQWEVGYETEDRRQVQMSPQHRYEAIYDDQEIVLYDRLEEQLLSVYRFDSLDSDYVYDEYRHYKLHVLDVLDNGDVLFAVAGYIQDKSEWTGKNGILFYRYGVGSGLKQLVFFENGQNVDALMAWVDDGGYYSSDSERFYLEDKQMLYSVDLKHGEAQYIDTFFDGRFNMETGTVFWQGNDSKVNGGIYTMDLNDYPLEVHNLYKAGVTQRVVGVDNRYIFVGDYKLSNTYEALDQSMIYGYSTIRMYNYAGKLLASYDGEDGGGGSLFGEAYLDDQSGEWKADYIQIQEIKNGSPKTAEVRFLPMRRQKILAPASEPTDMSKGQTNDRMALDKIVIETTKASPTSLYIEQPQVKREVSHMTKFEDLPLRDAYVYEASNGKRIFTGTYAKALSLGVEAGGYKIYRMDYEPDQLETHRFTLLFDADDKKESAYIGNIITIPQRPELPRGCEVTALSILLHYYMDDAPDKMQLNAEMIELDDVYQVVDGMIEFGNMHVGFAGSSSDTALPGLGVYIEPIQDLAETYMPGQIIPLTGADFEQILTYVSMEHPVLVIIPNRYQAVPDYSKEVWRTETGYMEVTYQEHSVVIMGYDDQYVYYSDPSKGIIDRKDKQNFREAWISMGSQAMSIN